MTNPRLRSDLHSVPAYLAGVRLRSQDVPTWSLASNEVPFGPLPGVTEALFERMHDVNRYPDIASNELTLALSERLGVGPDQLSLGTGSVAVCQHVVMATSGPGDEVIFAWRSFEAYPIVTTLMGATSVRVPLLPDGRHDLPAMADAITDRTTVIFVCTPNNPTGPAVTQAELTEFLDRVPPHIVVVVDEAYFEFGLHESGAADLDGVMIGRGRPNVVVLRTFSKAYGLAGLRVGYAVADPVVASALRKCATPFGVSLMAQTAALISLDQTAELQARVARVRAERARVVAAARGLGYAIPDTAANFYWVPLGDDAEAFAHASKERGVTVRAFAGDGVRITVGEPEASNLVLGLLAEHAAGRLLP